jgi:hypothetical protein
MGKDNNQDTKIVLVILGVVVTCFVLICSGITVLGYRTLADIIEKRNAAEKFAETERREAAEKKAEETAKRNADTERKRRQAAEMKEKAMAQLVTEEDMNNRQAEERRQLSLQLEQQKTEVSMKEQMARQEILAKEQAAQRQQEELDRIEANRIHVEFETAFASMRQISDAVRRWSPDIFNRTVMPNSSGKGPGLSWRVHLLPYIGQQQLYERFHLAEPWDSEHNLSLVESMPPFLSVGASTGKTRFRTTLSVDGPSPMTVGEITDGLNQTSLLMFTALDHEITWTQPDSTQPALTLDQSAVSNRQINLLTVSGNLASFAPKRNQEQLSALQSPAGNEHIREKTLLQGDRSDLGVVFVSGESTIHSGSDAEIQSDMRTIASAMNRWFEALKDPRRQQDLGVNENLSWQVHLLPYLGEEELFRKFRLDEPWYSEHNLEWIDSMPAIYGRGAAKGRSRFYALLPYNSNLGVFLQPNLNWDHHLCLSYAAPHKASTWTATTWKMASSDGLTQSMGWPLDVPVISGLANGEAIVLPAGLHFSKLSALLAVENKPKFNLEKALASPTDRLKLDVVIKPASAIEGLSLLPEVATIAGGLKSPVAMDAVVVNRLKTLGQAVLNYESAFKRSPVSVKRADGTLTQLSWRVHILPYIDKSALYEKFALDEPWDSPNNSKLLEFMPEIFQNATSKSQSSLHVLTGQSSLLGNNRNWMATATDGIHNTIMLMDLPSKYSIPWTQPEVHDVNSDLRFKDFADEKKRLNVALGDGATMQFQDLPESVFLGLATSNGGEIVDAASVGRWSAAQRGEYFVDPQFRVMWQRNQLGRLSLGMLNHESAYKFLPPQRNQSSAIIPPEQYHLSWRVHLLPFLGDQTLYNQFRMGEPWDSPHNLQLIPCMPDCFRDAADMPNSTETRIMVFSGPGTLFPEPGRALKFSQISDGNSNTICIFRAPANIRVGWTKPEDFDLDATNAAAAIQSLKSLQNPFGLQVALVDGYIGNIPPGFDAAKLLAMITASGNEIVSMRDLGD